MAKDITKEQLLNMATEELINLPSIDIKESINPNSEHCTLCTDCVHCASCINCHKCFDCRYCIGINNANHKQFVVFGIQLTFDDFIKIYERMLNMIGINAKAKTIF